MAGAGAAGSSAGPEQPDLFCLCAMFMPGLPWSESPEARTFSKWADGFFPTEGTTYFPYVSMIQMIDWTSS